MSGFRETWRAMHTRQFWGILVVLLAWIALGLWLESRIDWPERYGFHTHGKGGYFIELWHSPTLLRHGDAREYEVFVWLWSMPAFFASLVAWVKLRKRRTPGDLPPPKNF